MNVLVFPCAVRRNHKIVIYVTIFLIRLKVVLFISVENIWGIMTNGNAFHWGGDSCETIYIFRDAVINVLLGNRSASKTV